MFVGLIISNSSGSCFSLISVIWQNRLGSKIEGSISVISGFRYRWAPRSFDACTSIYRSPFLRWFTKVRPHLESHGMGPPTGFLRKDGTVRRSYAVVFSFRRVMAPSQQTQSSFDFWSMNLFFWIFNCLRKSGPYYWNSEDYPIIANFCFLILVTLHSFDHLSCVSYRSATSSDLLYNCCHCTSYSNCLMKIYYFLSFIATCP